MTIETEQEELSEIIRTAENYFCNFQKIVESLSEEGVDFVVHTKGQVLSPADILDMTTEYYYSEERGLFTGE